MRDRKDASSRHAPPFLPPERDGLGHSVLRRWQTMPPLPRQTLHASAWRHPVVQVPQVLVIRAVERCRATLQHCRIALPNWWHARCTCGGHTHRGAVTATFQVPCTQTPLSLFGRGALHSGRAKVPNRYTELCPHQLRDGRCRCLFRALPCRNASYRSGASPSERPREPRVSAVRRRHPLRGAYGPHHAQRYVR